MEEQFNFKKALEDFIENHYTGVTTNNTWFKDEESADKHLSKFEKKQEKSEEKICFKTLKRCKFIGWCGTIHGKCGI